MYGHTLTTSAWMFHRHVAESINFPPCQQLDNFLSFSPISVNNPIIYSIGNLNVILALSFPSYTPI